MEPNVGKIAFSNCEPVYHGFRTGALPQPFELISATPATLAVMLKRAQLDISPVSSTEYLANREAWELLSGLCIASLGAVESVLLFSRLPFAELGGQLVHLSRKSRTSNTLVGPLLADLFSVRCDFRLPQPGDEPAAFLAIGDEALLARGRPDFPHVLDLGQAWGELTGKSLVFAVWVARRAYLEREPAGCKLIHRLLLESKELGKRDLQAVARYAHPLAGQTPGECARYLALLRFDLDELDVAGLAEMERYLLAEGLLPSSGDLRRAGSG
jgi:chorismate dehydratase